MSPFKVKMIRINDIAMEKIMRRIIVIVLWSSIFMIFNSCMPIDISEPPSYTENNLAPIIVSTTPRSLHSPYYLSEFQTFDIRVIDLNENDERTVAWYVKDVSSEGKLVPLNGLTYKRPATNDYTIDEKAKFSITLKEST